MEGKTPTERVHGLATLVAVHEEKLKALALALDNQASAHAQTAQALANLTNAVVRLQE